jgi:phosphoglycolate phosphatase-like HAD superfamily hydrolase
MADEAASVLLLWDVDHTLIENAGVSKENYALAFEILAGRVPGVQPQTDGRTDVGIMADLLSDNGEDPAAYSLKRQRDALAAAASRNSGALAARGHALPGAAACLARASGETGVLQSVLTGNIQPNAILKLRAFGLDIWMDWEIGGFGWDSPVRARLVPAAQERASEKHGFDAARDVTVVVGDTTLDVTAGIDGGARVIAVATGIFSRQQLAAAAADIVLDGLADVDAFMDALGTARKLGPVPARL